MTSSTVTPGAWMVLLWMVCLACQYAAVAMYLAYQTRYNTSSNLYKWWRALTTNV